MIKLSSILPIDNLTWGQPSENDIEKMAADRGELNGFDLSLFMATPPPKNSSEKTKRELQWIEKIPNNKKLIDAADDVKKYFQDFIESKGYDFPKDYVEKLIKMTNPIIRSLKFYYNRPRPNQLDKYHGLKVSNYFLSSMGTPAYPSGHSTQGIFIGNVLADMFPKYKKELLKLGKDISYSRLVSKAHYPSDSNFGEHLGMELYRYWRKNHA